jgi:hypothetical protein
VSNLTVQEESVVKPSEEELEAYAIIAKKLFKDNLSLTQKAIENDSNFASLVETPLNPEEMLVKGTVVLGAQFAIASAFIHSWISTNTPLHFSDMDVRFKADVWGIGLGGGVIWLSGWMSESAGSAILGDVHFVFTTNPVHTEIAFFKGSTPIGVLAGGGLNIQVGTFGGNGSFKKW